MPSYLYPFAAVVSPRDLIMPASMPGLSGITFPPPVDAVDDFDRLAYTWIPAVGDDEQLQLIGDLTEATSPASAIQIIRGMRAAQGPSLHVGIPIGSAADTALYGLVVDIYFDRIMVMIESADLSGELTAQIEDSILGLKSSLLEVATMQEGWYENLALVEVQSRNIRKTFGGNLPDLSGWLHKLFNEPIVVVTYASVLAKYFSG